MLAIVIRVKGLDGLPAKIKRIRVGVLARLSMALAQIGEQVAARSTQDYLSGPRPRKLDRRSGDLARDVNYKVSGNRVVVGTTLRYAAIHERGGVIVPKRAKALVFKTDTGWATAARVVIPARPFLRPALRDAKPSILSIIRRMTNEAVQEALA